MGRSSEVKCICHLPETLFTASSGTLTDWGTGNATPMIAPKPRGEDPRPYFAVMDCRWRPHRHASAANCSYQQRGPGVNRLAAFNPPCREKSRNLACTRPDGSPVHHAGEKYPPGPCEPLICLFLIFSESFLLSFFEKEEVQDLDCSCRRSKHILQECKSASDAW
jgi:hypothetical protein